MSRIQEVTPAQLALIGDTYGVYMHGNRVRINLLLTPEVAVQVIGCAGHENVAHWVKRQVESIVEDPKKVSKLDRRISKMEMKIDKLLAHVVG